MANELGLRFNIGDRIHANCYTDHLFPVEVEIVGIANFDLAERYQDILLSMFNSDNADELYEEFLTGTVYYYLCRVLDITDLFNEGDMIVLTDKLIQEEGTYYLNQHLSMYVEVSFSTVTNYKSKEDLMEDLKYYLATKGVDEVEIYEELSYQEKLDYELNEYRSIITSLKGLKSMEHLVDKINTLFNTLVSKITNLIEKINNKE